LLAATREVNQQNPETKTTEKETRHSVKEMQNDKQQCRHSLAQLQIEIREMKCFLQIETAVQFFQSVSRFP